MVLGQTMHIRFCLDLSFLELKVNSKKNFRGFSDGGFVAFDFCSSL